MQAGETEMEGLRPLAIAVSMLFLIYATLGELLFRQGFPLSRYGINMTLIGDEFFARRFSLLFWPSQANEEVEQRSKF